MFRFTLLILGVMVLLSVNVRAQRPTPEADAAAIKQTALDYIEGWYEGNPERMERALHPELAKRISKRIP